MDASQAAKGELPLDRHLWQRRNHERKRKQKWKALDRLILVKAVGRTAHLNLELGSGNDLETEIRSSDCRWCFYFGFWTERISAVQRRVSELDAARAQREGLCGVHGPLTRFR